MRRIIYVQQFECWWALTPAEWVECIRRWFADETWVFGEDMGRTLAGPPRHAYRLRGSGTWNWSHPDHALVQPLDWDDDDWRDAAETAGVKV